MSLDNCKDSLHLPRIDRTGHHNAFVQVANRNSLKITFILSNLNDLLSCTEQQVDISITTFGHSFLAISYVKLSVPIIPHSHLLEVTSMKSK